MPPTRGISWLSLVLYGIRIGGNPHSVPPRYFSHFSPDGSPQSVARSAVDVDFLLDGQHQQHHVPVLTGQQEVVL